jgi:plasmid maintenance system antidote protein VapI
MEERGWTEDELAWTLGYSPGFLRSLLASSVITPQLALRLEAALGEAAETWMDIQRDLDMARLRDRMGGDLARIRRRAAQPIPDLP